MDLSPYIKDLQEQLTGAAKAGGEESRNVAQHLLVPLDVAARMVLLEALSAAAGEVTREIAPGSVDVRLRGRDPEFVVSLPSVDQFAESGEQATVPDSTADSADDVALSRVTLRLTDPLKQRVEEAAGKAGLSVNAWLVRAISASLDTEVRRPSPRDRFTGNNYTGWVR
jgi:hypothetical protein